MNEQTRHAAGSPSGCFALLSRLRELPSLPDRLRMLAAFEAARPIAAQEMDRDVSAIADREAFLDEAARLLKAWCCHRCGRAAERDYYLHAFERAGDRSALREFLGISEGWQGEALVFLITVDCLRADHLSCSGHPQPTTPAVDALAGQGVNFRRAYSTAGATPQSFVGILLSNFFQNVGSSRGLPAHLTTLAEALSAEGFHTVAFNAANVLTSHFYGYDRGFDEFCDFFDPVDAGQAGDTFVANVAHSGKRVTELELRAVCDELEARPDLHAILLRLTRKTPDALLRHIAGLKRYNYDAGDIVRCAIRSLRDNRRHRAQFYWLHLMDVHEPISVPFSRLGQFSPVEQCFLNAWVSSSQGRALPAGLEADYRRMYDSAVSYVDLNLGILLNFLADNGLLDRSLVCLTADHGQELLEQGLFGHGYDRLVESVVHVPLVFGGGLARRIDGSLCERAVSSLDIAPTVLDVCGIRPPASFLGSSLDDTRPRPVYGQTFYDGVRNRTPDTTTRRLFLKPYPRPVKEFCKEMFFCIEDHHQLIHDTATGKSELHALRPLPGAPPPREAPDPDRLKRQAEAYFQEVYNVPEHSEGAELSQQERGIVEHRLRQLGYL